jgi:hypothetical protein
MLDPQHTGVEPRTRGGVMRAGHYLVIGAVAIVAAVVAFAVLSFVVGVVFEVVKVAIVLAIIGAAIWVVSRAAHRRH